MVHYTSLAHTIVSPLTRKNCESKSRSQYTLTSVPSLSFCRLSQPWIFSCEVVECEIAKVAPMSGDGYRGSRYQAVPLESLPSHWRHAPKVGESIDLDVRPTRQGILDALSRSWGDLPQNVPNTHRLVVTAQVFIIPGRTADEPYWATPVSNYIGTILDKATHSYASNNSSMTL